MRASRIRPNMEFAGTSPRREMSENEPVSDRLLLCQSYTFAELSATREHEAIIDIPQMTEDLIARYAQFVLFGNGVPILAAYEARSISQIARPNAKICRLGSDQDAGLSRVCRERKTIERFIRARDQVAVEVWRSAAECRRTDSVGWQPRPSETRYNDRGSPPSRRS
jgi:hypothetical protein